MRKPVFFGWWVVMAASIGMATGVASVNLFSFGIFQQPLMAEFGWSRTQIAMVLVIGTLVTVAVSPLIGSLVDRHGARRVAIPSIVLLSLTLGSLYFLTPSLWHLYFIFGLMPIVGGGTASVCYARVVTRWFDRQRGLALGLTLMGVGIGGAIIPPTARWLIEAYGWRMGYVALGLVGIVLTLPLIIALLHDSPANKGLEPDGEPATAASKAASPVGIDGATARRTPVFRMLMIAFLILGVAIGGVMLQLVPILEDRGVARSDAAWVASLLAVGIILGRVVAGWLMDRYHAPHVAIAFLLGPIIGVSLLASGATGSMAAFAALCLGLAAGAELDVMAYLVTRYFGMRAFGALYGALYSMWTLGSGTAPALTAAVRDATGSFTPILWVYVAFFVVACVILARLGPYPTLPAAEPESPPSGAPATA